MSSPERIYHTWDKWECFPAGFYNDQKEAMSKEQCEEAYRSLLSDKQRFDAALSRVISEWKNSCEHYLTNDKMNRIAWLGQAAACIDLGIPSKYRAGYFLLSDEQKQAANELALKYLNRWLIARGHDPVDLLGAGISAEVNLY